MQHLVIVRTAANYLNINTYNCQELGLAKALSKKGLKVSLVLAGKKNQKNIILCDGNTIEVHYLQFISFNLRFGYFLGIKKKIQELNPDLIQVHDVGIFMTYVVTKWAKRHAIPCYLIQGTYQLSQKLIVKQIEYLFCLSFGKFILKNVDKIGCKTIAASRYIKSYIDRETNLTHIGLDDKRFNNTENIAWRKNLGIEKKRILLYVGTIETRRNPLFLVNILSQLPNDYVLIIVGSGALKEALQTHINASNVSQRCIMLGKLQQEQLPSLYKTADLFLLASNYEIYGMVILEAMYFGLPVISTLTAGSETIIKNGEDGIIIPELNDVKWAETIYSLVENKERLARMKNKASTKIQNTLLWEKAAEEFWHLYFSNNNYNILLPHYK